MDRLRLTAEVKRCQVGQPCQLHESCFVNGCICSSKTPTYNINTKLSSSAWIIPINLILRASIKRCKCTRNSRHPEKSASPSLRWKISQGRRCFLQKWNQAYKNTFRICSQYRQTYQHHGMHSPDTFSDVKFFKADKASIPTVSEPQSVGQNITRTEE